jgi:hypothetical protein
MWGDLSCWCRTMPSTRWDWSTIAPGAQQRGGLEAREESTSHAVWSERQDERCRITRACVSRVEEGKGVVEASRSEELCSSGVSTPTLSQSTLSPTTLLTHHHEGHQVSHRPGADLVGHVSGQQRGEHPCQACALLW